MPAGKHKENLNMFLLLQSCQRHKVFHIHWKLLSLTAIQDLHFHAGEREEIRVI